MINSLGRFQKGQTGPRPADIQPTPYDEGSFGPHGEYVVTRRTRFLKFLRGKS